MENPQMILDAYITHFGHCQKAFKMLLNGGVGGEPVRHKKELIKLFGLKNLNNYPEFLKLVYKPEIVPVPADGTGQYCVRMPSGRLIEGFLSWEHGIVHGLLFGTDEHPYEGTLSFSVFKTEYVAEDGFIKISSPTIPQLVAAIDGHEGVNYPSKWWTVERQRTNARGEIWQSIFVGTANNCYFCRVEYEGE